MLMTLSSVCLSAFKSIGHLTEHITFQITLQKEVGTVRSSEQGDHMTLPKQEITHCNNKGQNAAMLITC
jgi:hypothetical protein